MPTSDDLYETYQHYGTNAERLAFTPNPPVIAGVQPIYIWYETDTDSTYIYDTSWHLVTAGTPTPPTAEPTIHPFLLMGG